MKKFLFYFVLFSSVYMNAQKTIVEEKFEKNSTPMRYYFLPNSDKIVMEKGEKGSSTLNIKINSISSYDSNGKKEILANNFECLKSRFSITENTFQLEDFEKFKIFQSYKYVVNGKKSLSVNRWERERNDLGISSVNDVNHIFGKNYFNDKYELDIVNSKGKNKVNFEKDDLYLETFDFFSKKQKITLITKPDLKRLLDNEQIQPEEYLGYATNIIDNDKFEIVTKSISKDYKSSVLYRTFYNMEGKLVNEIKYPVTLPTKYLIYSASSCARISQKLLGFKNATPIFQTDIAINDFIEDNFTKDIYVYGLFGNTAKKLNDDNSPAGYYVFKFDSAGNKIWESINTIDDKDNFNKKIHLVRLSSNLLNTDKGLFFEAVGLYSDDYLHYSFLDKNSGKIMNKNKILHKGYKSYLIIKGKEKFIYSSIKHDDFKDKFFDIRGLVAIESNKNFADYLRKIDSKKKLYFDTIFSVKGIWLIESDNESYYKVTFFNY